MRVAHIREQKGAKYLEVVFLESARFYKLSREHPEFARVLRQLREAKEKKSAVRVLTDVPEGDVIKDVEASG
jgi:hypothetical protein